jgi:hypothetical protein
LNEEKLFSSRPLRGFPQVIETLPERVTNGREAYVVNAACAMNHEWGQHVETRVVKNPVLDGEQHIIFKAFPKKQD